MTWNVAFAFPALGEVVGPNRYFWQEFLRTCFEGDVIVGGYVVPGELLSFLLSHADLYYFAAYEPGDRL